MPKLYPYLKKKDHNEDDNKIKRELFIILHMLLSRNDDAIPTFIILIAWILFMLNGLLDQDEFSLLNIYDGDLDNLPWHSDNPLAIMKWIPQAFLLVDKKKSIFLILKLKSFFNLFFYLTFRSPFYSVKRIIGKGVGIFSKYDNIGISDVFGGWNKHSRFVNVILRCCDEDMFIKLNECNYISTFELNGRLNVIVGPATLAILNKPTQDIRLAQLRCFAKYYNGFPMEDRLFFSFERKIATYEEKKLEGFDDHEALCSSTGTDYYSLGKDPPKVKMIGRMNDEEGGLACDESCYSLRCESDDDFGPGVELNKITETYKGCIFEDHNINNSMKKIGKSDQILFSFFVEEKRTLEEKHKDDEDNGPPQKKFRSIGTCRY